MLQAALRRLDAVNRRHPWSHNAAWTPWVLAHARAVRRAGGTAALDVGCGTGDLLRRLSDVLPEVTGIEPDPATAALARASVAGRPGARVVAGRFEDLGAATTYDLVVPVASLHHLRPDHALPALRAHLRPGGRLVVVGLHRETAADRPLSWLSLVLNPVVGLLRHPHVARREPVAMTAPVAEPRVTLAELRAAVRRTFPGARVRRRLFWRHTITWTAPPSVR